MLITKLAIRLILLGGCLAFIAAPDAFAAPRIKTFDPAGSVSTQATGINVAGSIVGVYFDSQANAHGFLRDSSGTITAFDVPGASTGDFQGTYAEAVNDTGVIAGYYNTSSTAIHGFVRDTAGNFTTFDVTGETVTRAFGINNAGEVVGISLGGGFVRDALGNISTFLPSGASIVQYVGINSSGQVTGTYADSTVFANHGFSRDTSGNITTFDVPGAIQTNGYGTFALSLNDLGTIAGFWVDTSLAGHGYVRSPAGVITSYDVSGALSTVGFSINHAGTVTGHWYAGTDAYFHGFVRNRFGVIRSFDVPKSVFEGTLPTGINNNGEVCGNFLGSDGNTHGFLLIP